MLTWLNATFKQYHSYRYYRCEMHKQNFAVPILLALNTVSLSRWSVYTNSQSRCELNKAHQDQILCFTPPCFFTFFFFSPSNVFVKVLLTQTFACALRRVGTCSFSTSRSVTPPHSLKDRRFLDRENSLAPASIHRSAVLRLLSSGHMAKNAKAIWDTSPFSGKCLRWWKFLKTDWLEKQIRMNNRKRKCYTWLPTLWFPQGYSFEMLEKYIANC